MIVHIADWRSEIAEKYTSPTSQRNHLCAMLGMLLFAAAVAVAAAGYAHRYLYHTSFLFLVSTICIYTHPPCVRD